jgi:hypothetical protein
MHPGRAGAYDDTRKSVFFYGVFYYILARFRAHILVVFGKYHAGLYFRFGHYSVDIDSCRDIAAAPADKYSNFMQILTPPLLSVPAKRTDERLLGNFIVRGNERGYFVRDKVRASLFAFSQYSYRRDNVCRFYASGAALNARKAA